MMALEPHGPDVYVGQSPHYPWGRVYGGQVVAQSLQAAIHTVEDRFATHSLHGYFIRGGTSDEPIRFEVDRIRNGRSFVTRRVVARQSNGAIFNLSASFQVHENGADVTARPMPDGVPLPDELPDSTWSPMLQRRSVPRDAVGGATAVWIRVPLPDDANQALSQLALAYASDDVPYDAAASVHPNRRPDVEHDESFMGASLDHSLWFHREAPAGDWRLHYLEPMGYTGNRGLAFGRVYSTDGLHLASVTQEILFRYLGHD